MNITRYLLPLIFMFCSNLLTHGQSIHEPLRVAIHGLTHTHVHWILGREDRGDIELVGIAEENRDLAKRYAGQYGLPDSMLYEDLATMLAETQPEAVLAFNSIYGHLETVEACAPLGIDVMVEKPLTYRLDHLERMEALVEKHNIRLLTNYETTWYPTLHRAYDAIHEEKAIGELRKLVFMTGHQGPQEIGVNSEFLEWLTDPEQNGAGALVDFGCYGANIATWLMKGEAPLSVYAVSQQIKPEIYPKVDDETTIILTYPKAQVIIQASWNWPFNRKDTEIYGQTGKIYQANRSDWQIHKQNQKPKEETFAELEDPFDDPFAYMAALIRGKIKEEPYSLSSLENNRLVVEILAAAIRSAETGETIRLRE